MCVNASDASANRAQRRPSLSTQISLTSTSRTSLIDLAGKENARCSTPRIWGHRVSLETAARVFGPGCGPLQKSADRTVLPPVCPGTVRRAWLLGFLATLVLPVFGESEEKTGKGALVRDSVSKILQLRAHGV